MEVMIAVSLLSAVVFALFQIKSNNIFILTKATQESKNKEYLMMAMDTKEYSQRNENIYLDRLYSIQDDDLRREFKRIKIKIKDEILDTEVFKVDNFSLEIKKFKTTYSFEDSIKKDIYRFELKL